MHRTPWKSTKIIRTALEGVIPATVFLLVGLLGTGVSAPSRVFAHQPHDAVHVVAVSPDFAADGILFVIRDEKNTLYKSVDGGRSFYPPTDPAVTRDPTTLVFSSDFALDRTVFMGTMAEGIYRSADRGETWELSGTGLTDLHVTALAAAPGFQTFGTVFAGAQGGKLFRSTDGGYSWGEAASLGGEITDLAVSPGFAGDGTIYASVNGGGIARSLDGGTTWVWVNTGLGNLNVTALSLSPDFMTDGVLFAATLGGGVFRSRDTGDSWKAVNTGISDLRVNDVVVAPNRSLFAVSQGKGVYRSSDGGANWALYQNGIGDLSPQTSDHFRSLAVSPGYLVDTTVFAGMFEGLYVSRDKGGVWKETNYLPVTLDRSIGISPVFGSDGTLFAGTLGGGLLKTLNQGGIWEAMNRGLDNTYIDPMAVSPDYASDGTLFLGTTLGLFKSTDGGTTWALHSLKPGSTLYVREVAASPDYATDRVIFASSETGQNRGVFRSDDGGVTWVQRLTGLPTSGMVTALAVSPGFTADGTLLAGISRKGVYRSTDGGVTWSAANTGMETETLENLAFSPEYAVDRTVFAATTDAGIFRSTDGGVTWLPANQGLPYTRTTAVVLSPDYPMDGTVFAGAFQGGVYRSTDGGGTWAPMNAGLLPTEVRKIVLSPDFPRDGILFAGTGRGVYRSLDGGNSWRLVQTLNRYENNSDNMTFSGTWTLHQSDQLSGGTLFASKTFGAEASFEFSGKTLRWIGTRGPGHGAANLYLDGTFLEAVDLYHPTTQYSVTIKELTGLSGGWHTVTVAPAGWKNGAASGYYVTVDAFDVELPSNDPIEVIREEFSVNQLVNQDQDHATVSMAPAGNFMAVWHDKGGSDGNGMAVSGRLFNDIGTPISDEFPVNDTVLGDQQVPDVASAPDGRFVTVWTGGTPAGGYAVFAKIFQPTGEVQVGEFHVNETLSEAKIHPDAAVYPDGDFIVAWDELQAGEIRYYTRLYDAAGNPLGPPLRINSVRSDGPPDPTFSYGLPDIGINDLGDAVVVWERITGMDVAAAGCLLNPYTGVVGPEFLVSPPDPGMSQRRPMASLNHAGDILVTWAEQPTGVDSGDVYVRKYNAASGVWETPIRPHNWTLDNQYLPVAELADDGRFVVAWTGHSFFYADDVYMRYYDAQGAPLTQEILVNRTQGNHQKRPALDWRPFPGGDLLVITWESQGQDGSGTGIYGKLYRLP